MTSIAATNTALPASSSVTASRAAQASQASQASQPSSADVSAAQAQLDAPDPTYPALSGLHVGLLQAMGTPAATIAEIAARKPEAAWLDSYIQDEIMQNPEGWDDYVHNPRGTARAGITQVFPNVTLPAPGAGFGRMPSDSTSIPGITTPLLDPGATPTYSQASDTEKLVKTAVWGAIAVGVGLLAWKFVKGRGATEVAREGAAMATGGGGGFVEGVKGMLRGGGAKAAAEAGSEGLKGLAVTGGGAALGGNIASMGMSETARTARHMLIEAVKTDNAGLFKKAVGLAALAEGGQEFAATAMSIVSGAGAVNGHVAAAGFGAVAFNIPVKQAADIALDALRVDAGRAATLGAQLAGSGGAEAGATQLLGVIQRLVT